MEFFIPSQQEKQFIKFYNPSPLYMESVYKIYVSSLMCQSHI